jgi:UTP-glucose-1-phosphate uridylyltransferase
MTTYQTMHEQAGNRIIITMTNGKYNLTSHYKNQAEFEQRLAEKNEDARQWGDPLWYKKN